MKKQKECLLINDIHIGTDDVVDVEANWNEAVDICLDRGIRTIIIGGDLFKSRVAQTLRTLLMVKRMLAHSDKCGIDVIMAPGNHDKVDLEDALSYCHMYEDMPGVKVVYDHHEFIMGEDKSFSRIKWES